MHVWLVVSVNANNVIQLISVIHVHQEQHSTTTTALAAQSRDALFVTELTFAPHVGQEQPFLRTPVFLVQSINANNVIQPTSVLLASQGHHFTIITALAAQFRAVLCVTQLTYAPHVG
jgi:hypothetical protein